MKPPALESPARRTPRAPRRAIATRGVPPDLLRDTARRLALAGLVFAIGFGFQLALSQVFLRLGWARTGIFAIRTAIHGAALLTGLVVMVLARRPGLSPARLVTIGLTFEIVGGFLLVLPESFVLAVASPHGMTGISWLAVWVTVFPLLVPARPLVMAASGLVTASMSPLAVALVVGLGLPRPPNSTLTFAFLPNYVAAALAVVSATVLHRLRRQAEEGRVLGSYQLVERLGEGGMGEVWRASHRMLARPAAIKLIGREALAISSGEETTELVARFEREAQATASLGSPHTVALYDYGVTEDGAFYYVMELLRGLDLEKLVERTGPVPPERAASFLVQACESLEEAHARGLIHRDIKPANLFACVLGGRHDFVKILDFGLVARDARDRSDIKLTSSEAFRGTPAYIAPEVASGQPAEAASDLYALGCVAYWLLTGRTVFEGRSSYEVVSQHLHATPEPPARRAPQPIPEGLDELVLRCLAKRPEDRPAGARELAALVGAIPFERPWTETRAAEWWREHLPGEIGATAPHA